MLRNYFARYILPVAVALFPPEMCAGLHVRLSFLLFSPTFYSLFRTASAWWYSLSLSRYPPIFHTTGGEVNFCGWKRRALNEYTLIRMGAWVDLALMTLTFVFSIIWDVEVGVVVSLIISLLLVVHRSSKARMTILVSLAFHFDYHQSVNMK